MRNSVQFRFPAERESVKPCIRFEPRSGEDTERFKSSHASSSSAKNRSVASNNSATRFTAGAWRNAASNPFSVRGFQSRCNAKRICPLETLKPTCREATASTLCASSKITKSFLKRTPPSASSSRPPSSVKNNVWLSTSTSAERMRLRARWKKQRQFCLPNSDAYPQIFGEQIPRSEQTCAHTFASGSMSKSDRLPSPVCFDHS